jgi:hypothetical protein
LTDLQKWRAFLDDFSVKYTEDDAPRPNSHGFGGEERVHEIEIQGAKFLMGVLIEFDMAGRFLSIGGS